MNKKTVVMDDFEIWKDRVRALCTHQYDLDLEILDEDAGLKSMQHNGASPREAAQALAKKYIFT